MSFPNPLKLCCGAALVAALTVLNVQAQSPGAPPADRSKLTVKDIGDCLGKNLVNRGALRDLTVQPTDREGKSRTLKMRFFWKPTPKREPRVNLRLMEPLAIAGSSYLLVMNGRNEEVYFHFPNTDHALRITGENMSQPMWGTDVSYGEIKQVLGLLASGPTERKADAKVSGRDAYVLETTTRAEDTGYQKVVSYVDQQACVLLKSEFFAKPGQPRKVLEADVSTLLSADTYWLVLGYTMRDLREGTQTVLNLSDFSPMERMPERLFDPKRFFEAFE